MTEREDRLITASHVAYDALVIGTGGDPHEISSCLAALFIEVIRICGVPDDDALATLKAAFEATPRDKGH